MDDDLNTIIPDLPTKGYDMKAVIRRIVDNGEFLEVQEHFAGNILVGFARLGGRSVGYRGPAAAGAGGRARHRLGGQGGALRALLRLLQHPD